MTLKKKKAPAKKKVTKKITISKSKKKSKKVKKYKVALPKKILSFQNVTDKSPKDTEKTRIKLDKEIKKAKEASVKEEMLNSQDWYLKLEKNVREAKEAMLAESGESKHNNTFKRSEPRSSLYVSDENWYNNWKPEKEEVHKVKLAPGEVTIPNRAKTATKVYSASKTNDLETEVGKSFAKNFDEEMAKSAQYKMEMLELKLTEKIGEMFKARREVIILRAALEHAYSSISLDIENIQFEFGENYNLDKCIK